MSFASRNLGRSFWLRFALGVPYTFAVRNIDRTLILSILDDQRPINTIASEARDETVGSLIAFIADIIHFNRTPRTRFSLIRSRFLVAPVFSPPAKREDAE
ncbi:hypothetical protein ZHAS_00020377 [Anopheles sinensis]|uniref:Uncharacterized protein n=1 Tax=Anopheles sinensis TaxID=74873 RepID=A0A084WPW7_ANOSI|nr:hypothetical protein ZHAS_00020377 [Anopheles sinensis]